MTAEPSQLPLKLFISYAHEDATFLKELDQHLTALVDEGLIERWHDREIVPGVDWENEIDTQLETADILVVLVSAASVNSKYVRGREVRRAQERAQAKNSSRPFFLVPVVIRAVDWENLPLGRKQALPKNLVPIANWDDRDVAWVDVVRGIRRIVESTRPKKVERIPVSSVPVVSPVADSIDDRPTPRTGSTPLRIAIAFVLLLVAGGLTWLIESWSDCRSYVRQGNALAGIGRPMDAKRAFKHASHLCPWWSDAKWGLTRMQVWEGKPGEPKVAFEQRVKNLFDGAPGDAYANLMMGDLSFSHGDLEAAMRHYVVAARDEGMAQAHFGKGAVYELRQQYQEALLAFRQARKISPSTPRYRSNEALMLSRLGKFDEAATAFAQIDRYPLANAELAKLLLRRDLVDEAAALLRRGIDLQQDPALARDSENRGRWSFQVDAQRFELGSPEVKLCYLHALLAVVHAWRLDDAESASQASKVRDCTSYKLQLRSLVESELRPLSKDAARSDALSRVLASI